MAIVIDSSAIIALAMEDEDATLIEHALHVLVAEGGFAPVLLSYEVRNALVINERRGRLTAERSQAFLDEVAKLPIEFDSSPSWDAVLTLARQHALTVYDAAYLELVLRKDAPLLTLDRQLRDAVTAAGGRVFRA